MNSLHDRFLVQDVWALKLTCRCCKQAAVLSRRDLDRFVAEHRCRRAA